MGHSSVTRRLFFATGFCGANRRILNEFEVVNVDKYVKMLIIKLSQTYKVTVTTIMYYSEDTGRIGNMIKLKIADKDSGEILSVRDYRSKRELISGMVAWVGE